jgi:glycosyltransferase involved in cell wall biosynthesis
MKRDVKLSLCMIARDEAATIGKALAAAKPFCDEMIVVDTGSTDGTREIAASLGARVVEQPWTDDFSHARNRSLSEAGGDFALVLDADEIIDAECGRGIREAIGRKDTAGVFLPIVNRFEDGRVLPALILRVFPLRVDVRYRYRIHEQVIDKLVPIAKRERGRLLKVDGAVVHDGYREDVIQARGKNERNLRIFELALADDPADLYLRYKFADFLRRFENEKPRIRELLESSARDLRKMDRGDVLDLPFSGEVFALLAQAYRDAGDARRGLACAEEGLRLAAITVNLEFIHASLALDLGDATTAARGFRQCLARDGEVLVMPGQCGVTGVLAEIGLARALHVLQRNDEAREVVQRAADRHPERTDLVELWLECARGTADPRSALGWLTRRLEGRPADATAWMAGAQILYGMQMFGQARTWFLRAAGGSADPSSALAWCAECFLHECNLEEALDVASKVQTDPRAQAVIAAISLFAETEVPSLVRCADADVRSAFRRLLDNLRRTPGSPIVEKIETVCSNMSVFDPAGIGLASSALATG